MSIESARKALEYSCLFTSGINMPGLNRQRLDAWVARVKSGQLTARLTERTPQLDRIELLCVEMMNECYELTLLVFHVGSCDLPFIQQRLDHMMARADEVIALIDAVPRRGNDYGYGADVRHDCYGVEVAEQGYCTALEAKRKKISPNDEVE